MTITLPSIIIKYTTAYFKTEKNHNHFHLYAPWMIINKLFKSHVPWKLSNFSKSIVVNEEERTEETTLNLPLKIVIYQHRNGQCQNTIYFLNTVLMIRKPYYTTIVYDTSFYQIER